MRRFILTNSNRFSGTVELIYNERETLCCIDMRAAEMDEQTIKLLVHNLPATLKELVQGRGFGKDTCIIEAEFQITFDMFWNSYGKKINKKRCEPLFDKLNKEQQVKAVHGIHAYNKFLHKESWRTKADPETYLRNYMWENDWR